MTRKRNKALDIAILILCIFGLLMNISASMGKYSDNSSALKVYALKQVAFLVVGLLGYNFMIYRFTFKKMRRYVGSEKLFYLYYFILLIPLLEHIVLENGNALGGAYAWITFGPLSLQPAEFAKILVILLIANSIAGFKQTSAAKINAWDVLKLPLIKIGIILGIIMFLQKDLGTATIILFIAYLLILIVRQKSLNKLQIKMFILLFIGIIVLLFLFSAPFSNYLISLDSNNYRIQRFISATNPFLDEYNSGYQIIKGLEAIASGGIFGVGFGNSIFKYMNFPAANSDFIVAIIIEELGILGFSFMFGLYVFILGLLVSNAMKLKDQRGKIVLFGVSLYIFIHMLFNIGGVSTLIPLTGVPLLLVSAGGSSEVAILISLGICQSIIMRYSKKEQS